MPKKKNKGGGGGGGGAPAASGGATTTAVAEAAAEIVSADGTMKPTSSGFRFSCHTQRVQGAGPAHESQMHSLHLPPPPSPANMRARALFSS